MTALQWTAFLAGIGGSAIAACGFTTSVLRAHHRARVKAMWAELTSSAQRKGEALTTEEIADIVGYWMGEG